ncbi:NUDIX domain-containing protein [Flavisolibacter sp. BT320]|nr:NUDIX domain-containing protein [Flavisolibacter longurius]
MRKSAGILLYRKRLPLEVFLVHPGGPYWNGKEEGAWGIPKGEFDDAEEPLVAARREFREETGSDANGPAIELVPIRQKAGKLVYAWAVEGDLDAATIVSNTFRQEYPYKSGKWITVPEVDKAGWFTLEEARKLMNPAQVPMLDDLLQKLDA